MNRVVPWVLVGVCGVLTGEWTARSFLSVRSLIALVATTLQPEFEKQARKREEENLSSAPLKDQSQDVVVSNGPETTKKTSISAPETAAKINNAAPSRRFGVFTFNSRKDSPVEGQTGKKSP